MTLMGLFKEYFASKRKVTVLELDGVIRRIQCIEHDLQAVENRAKRLEAQSTADLERQIKVLKTQVESMGLRIGFKAGSGIS